MILKTIILTFSLLVYLSSASESVNDYCVGDLSSPKGVGGYPCRNASTLTVDDFVFSGLNKPADTTNVFNLGLTFAFDFSFPALNGLGLSMIRLDIGVNGVVPVHTHRVSELILVIEGTIVAGFIDSNDVPFYKTLNKGDIMIFPQSLLHFQANVGDTPALCFVSLNSANPGLQGVTTSLFGNSLPSKLVERITKIDPNEVKRLKRMFGGSN